MEPRKFNVELPQANLAGAHRRLHDHATRYRLLVLGSDACDIVSSAGGLVCDCAMAGWDVQVYLDDPSDHLSLRVIGARARDLRTLPLQRAADEWPDVVAVAAKLYISQETVRHHICAATGIPHTGVVMWTGDESRTTLPQSLRPIEHRLSRAALAFKDRAVALIMDAAESVSETELYYLQ